MMLAEDTANHLIENQISEIELPMGVGMNLKVDGKAYVVPMATEEPSVIAAMSNGAKMAGEIHTQSKRTIVAGTDCFSAKNPNEIEQRIAENQALIFERAEQKLSFDRQTRREDCGASLCGTFQQILSRNLLISRRFYRWIFSWMSRMRWGANIINAILEGRCRTFQRMVS